jgi:hydroxymethylpyrimidine/phosphomethylpyrimidine kinase
MALGEIEDAAAAVFETGKLVSSDISVTQFYNRLSKTTAFTEDELIAQGLTNTKIKTKEDMIFAASILIKLGAKNVFIKGGHLDSKIVQDIFVNKNEIFIIKNKRITTRNTHGTGCTLSSAISTFFSCGKTLKRSCELATKYVHNSINSNLKFGKGHGPINHLSSVTVEKKFR